MFYDLQLLKKGGRFYLCHLAASWPSKFRAITNRTIRTCNLIDMCEDLRVLISTESSDPSQRFSLRLSVRLLMGLLTLFQRKVDLLAFDVLSYKDLVKKDKPKGNPPLTKEKNKPNTLAVTLLDPEAVLQNIPLDVNLNDHTVQNLSTITLMEVDQIVPPFVYENFGEENLNVDKTIPDDDRQLIVHTVDIHAPPRNIPAIMLNDNTIVNEKENVEINMVQDNPEIRIEIPLEIGNSNVIEEINNTTRQKIISDSINMTLESVVPNEPKRKKPKVKIIDNHVELSSDYIKNRLKDNIDLRCKEPREDAVWYGDIFNYKRFFTQPAFSNVTLNINNVFSDELCPLYIKNTITRPESNPKNTRTYILRPKEVVRADPKVDQSMKASFLGNTTNILSPSLHQTLNLIHENLELPCMMAHESVSRNDTILQDSLKHHDVTETGEPKRKKSKLSSTVNRSNESTTAVDVHSRPAPIKCSENFIHVESCDMTMIEKQIPPEVQFEEYNQTADIYQTVDNNNVNRLRNELSIESTSDDYKKQQKILSEFGDPHNLLVKIGNLRKSKKNEKITLYAVIDHFFDSSMPLTKRQLLTRSFYSLLKLKARGYVTIEKEGNSTDVFYINVNMEELKKLK